MYFDQELTIELIKLVVHCCMSVFCLCRAGSYLAIYSLLLNIFKKFSLTLVQLSCCCVKAEIEECSCWNWTIFPWKEMLHC